MEETLVKYGFPAFMLYFIIKEGFSFLKQLVPSLQKPITSAPQIKQKDSSIAEKLVNFIETSLSSLLGENINATKAIHKDVAVLLRTTESNHRNLKNIPREIQDQVGSVNDNIIRLNERFTKLITTLKTIKPISKVEDNDQ